MADIDTTKLGALGHDIQRYDNTAGVELEVSSSAAQPQQNLADGSTARKRPKIFRCVAKMQSRRKEAMEADRRRQELPCSSLRLNQNVKKRWTDAINIPVFTSAALALITLIIASSAWPDAVRSGLTTAHHWLNYNLGCLYITLGLGVIVSVMWLAFGPFGNVRLGDDDSEPEFSTAAWLSMIFCSAVSMGMVFYGVSEPITFYNKPPQQSWPSDVRREMAVPLALFHWGLHSWSLYTLPGISIAYFAYRKKFPLLFRSCFYPLLGNYIYSWPGHIVDMVAIIACVLGVSDSLGFGALNLAAGFKLLWNVPNTTKTQLLIVAGVTSAAIISLASGIHRGIKYLSYFTVFLGMTVVLIVYFSNSTRFISDSIVENTGKYVELFFDRSLHLAPLDPEEKDWITQWTNFYVAWSMTLGPYSGLFYARISKGRTIRQLVLGSTVMPTLISILWFTTFGSLAIHLDDNVANHEISEATLDNPATGIYTLFKFMPYTQFLSVGILVVMIFFFVTSSDSASFVVDLLAAGGCPDPPVWQRVFWGTMEGATTAVLLYTGGESAIYTLQACVGSVSLPMSIFYTLLLISLGKAISEECVTQPVVFPLPRSKMAFPAKEDKSGCVETVQTDQPTRTFEDESSDNFQRHNLVLP